MVTLATTTFGMTEQLIPILKMKDGIRSRLFEGIETAANLGEGKVVVLINDVEHLYNMQKKRG